MTAICFIVPGLPEPKPRPRGVRRGGFVSFYTPKTKLDYEGRVRKAYKHEMTKGNVKINATFVMPIPKSCSKRERILLIGEPHGKKPDLDNLIKSLMDGLNGIAYEDDSKVASITANKRYAIEDEDAMTIVRIEEMIKP